MNTAFNRRRIALTALAFGLLVVTFGLAAMSLRNSDLPLSASELRLMGNWSEPGKSRVFSFYPDRTFRSNDGQFAGNWSIGNGKLLLRYRQNEDPLSTLSDRLGLFVRGVESAEDHWDIVFDNGSDSLSLSLPGNDAVLTRLPGS